MIASRVETCSDQREGNMPACTDGSGDKPPRTAPPIETLTPREQAVAAAVAEGLTDAEVAEQLALTPGTVGNHLVHILHALGAKNRVQEAAWAVDQGLWSRAADRG